MCVKEFREVCYYEPTIRQGYFVSSDGYVYKLMKDLYLRKTNSDGSKSQTRIKNRIRKELGDMLDKGLNYTTVTIEGFEHYKLVLLRDGRLIRKMSECKINNRWTEYLYINLPKVTGGYKCFFVHRLVSQCFIGSVLNMEVHHIDRNQQNNNISNLMVLTPNEHLNVHLKEDF